MGKLVDGKQKFQNKDYLPEDLLNKLLNGTYTWTKQYVPFMSTAGICVLRCEICSAAGNEIELSTANVSDSIKSHERTKAHTNAVAAAAAARSRFKTAKQANTEDEVVEVPTDRKANAAASTGVKPYFLVASQAEEAMRSFSTWFYAEKIPCSGMFSLSCR